MNRNNPTRLDANESAFFKRELEYIKSETYDVIYKDLKATRFLPVSTEVTSGSTDIVYKSFSKVGMAVIISDYANDFPRVDIYGEEKTAKVRGVGDSYGYSIVEIRRAAKAGLSLERRRADAARRAIDELIDDIAWNGDADYGLQGFIDYPGITEYTVPNDGEGDTKTWSTKTPDQINRDVAGIVSAIINPTNGKEIPDTLLLPWNQYNLIATTRMTDGNDKTILTYIMENNPWLKRIDWLTELSGAGDSSTDRMMCYEYNPMKLTLELPQLFEQFEADKTGAEYVIPCYAETGGVIIYYPASVAYGDGI